MFLTMFVFYAMFRVQAKEAAWIIALSERKRSEEKEGAKNGGDEIVPQGYGSDR